MVTPRSLTRESHPAVQILRDAGYEVVIGRPGEQPTEEELTSLLPGCVGFLAGVEQISARALAAADSLVAISRNGVGVDNIDEEAARKAGIEILTTPGANSQAVSELALGLIFALARAIPASSQALKAGEWKRFRGLELASAALGVVGCGAIGRRVAESAACLGMRVLGYDPYPAAGFAPEGFQWVDLPTAISSSHVVSLHCPPQGRPVLDSASISSMMDGAYLVNTARAGLVDTEAVLSALDNGRLSGYAFDVYDQEPPADRRLVEHPRTVCTPHIGGYTEQSVTRAATQAAENLLRALEEREDG